MLLAVALFAIFFRHSARIEFRQNTLCMCVCVCVRTCVRESATYYQYIHMDVNTHT